MSRKARISLFVFAILSIATIGSSGAFGALSALWLGSGSANTVEATGDGTTPPLENFVEVKWHVDAPINVTDIFEITRDTTLLHVAASTETFFEDRTAVPATTYNYCVDLVTATNVRTQIGCVDGSRFIAQPTGFRATDGTSEEYVGLSWSDNSAIEAGYNVYRDGGKALRLDGTGGFVQIEDISLQGSFTIELWASRAFGSTDDVLIKLESAQGPFRSDPPLEISFDNTNALKAVYGFEELKLPAAVSDVNWHHWAVAFDQDSNRWYIYRDGVLVAEQALVTAFLSRGPMLIGRRRFNQTGFRVPTSGRGYFDGAVDEVRLWNIALTEEQVASRRSTMLTGVEAGLVNYWSMDDAESLEVRDQVGGKTGVINFQTPTASVIDSGLPSFRNTVGANITFFADRLALPGFGDANGDGVHTSNEPIYTYTVKAFEDVDGNGEFTPGVDYESLPRMDEGWRATLTPPGNMMATDGQFDDKVRITWLDLTSSEDGYRIYRDGVELTTTLPDVQLYDDPTAVGNQEYCVVAFLGAVESAPACDYGRMDLLAPPANVTATNGDFDDRVELAWNDTTATEDGFEIYRDSLLLVTLGADEEAYADRSAVQEVEYDYCVLAFSKADPLNVVRSAQTCAPAKGRRAAILTPTDMTASQAEFEDRVDLAWVNPATTTLLFKVLRDNQVIEVLDFNTTTASDYPIASDTDFEYAVVGVTVVLPVMTPRQGQVAQLLGSIKMANRVSADTGGEIMSAQETLSFIYQELGLDLAGKSGAAGLVESDTVKATGSRSITPPTDPETTPNEFESHVQLKWVDNSSVETNYRIFRTAVDAAGVPQGAEEPVDTLSANRTTYGDYTGVPGQPYLYRIAAFDDHGFSASATVVGLRTLKQPTQFVASDGTSEDIVYLSWSDNSSAEDGYRIFRRELGGVFGAAIATTGRSEPAYEDSLPTALLGVDSLEYRVVAFDAYGESLGLMDYGHTMIEAPGDVNASDTYAAEIVVVWTDRSMVEEGYMITRRAENRPIAETDTIAAFGSFAGAISVTDPTLRASLAANTTEFSDSPGLGRFVYCVLSIRGDETSDQSCEAGEYGTNVSGPAGGGAGGVKRFFRADFSIGLGLDTWLFGWSVAADGDGTVAIGAPGGFSIGAASEFNSDTGALVSTTLSGIPPYSKSVDVSGDYMVASDGAQVTMWDRGTTNRVDSWAVSGGADDFFEPAVANYDEWVIIGDPLKSATKGGAMVCKKDEATCVDLALVTSFSGIASGDYFGRSVDILMVTRTPLGAMATVDVLVAAVGAPGLGKDKARALVFECLVAAGCTTAANWAEVTKVSGALSALENTQFGWSLAVDGDYIVVGDHVSNGFELWSATVDSVGTAVWVQQEIVEAPDDPGRTPFSVGYSVAMRGDVILVGAPTTTRKDEFEFAGAAYVYSRAKILVQNHEATGYDARTGGVYWPEAFYGASVSIGDDFYLIGSPQELLIGAAYAIPFGTIPVIGTPPPGATVLTAASGVAASDGTAPDRIQVRWTDEAENESGQIIYRSREGGALEKLAEIEADAVLYDDFSAAAGEAYTYCVTAYSGTDGNILESDQVCDIGWRPANGTIAGIVAPAHGGATEGANICLSPSPNAAVLLDGTGGYLEGHAPEDAVMPRQFTLEAWVRPHGSGSGEQFITVRDQAYALSLVDGDIRIRVVTSNDMTQTLNVDTNLAVDQWHHISVTRQEDLALRAYVAGVQVGSEETSILQVKQNAPTDTVRIGRHGFGTEIDGFFHGEIDEIRFWNFAKTDVEIAAAHQMPLRGNEEGLVGYWPLDQGVRLVAPDVSESAIHVAFHGGAYPADDGAPVIVCGITDSEGQFSLSRIRYGETTEFTVTPSMEDREFEPGFVKVTLARDSPVQNQIFFVDKTAFTIAGRVEYSDMSVPFTCPAPSVGIHASKDGVVQESTLRATTGEDGSFVLALDPSDDATDPWYITPQFSTQADASGNVESPQHTFTASIGAMPTTPDRLELEVEENRFDLLFTDAFRSELSVSFTGGDPDPLICQKDVGIAELRIYTQDGCFDRIVTVNSQSAGAGDFHIDFELDLPPLNYLVDVVSVKDASGATLAEIEEFFHDLGTREVDLTQGDAELSLRYRAPLLLTVAGLEPAAMCAVSGISQLDNGELLRTLPNVVTLGEFEFRELTISVNEDYGAGGLCPVDEGSITIYDAISDRVDADSTISLVNGEAKYTVIGTSPNIFSGARIGGVDRSFQKPITVTAQVEGRPTLTTTEWALVEGFRERSATFVSATTEEFPLLIVHDPPGSNSYAYVEEGASFCTRFSNTMTLGGSGGFKSELRFGFQAETLVAPLGFGVSIDADVGLAINLGLMAGRDVTSLSGGPNRTICVTATEKFTTWSDWGNVGEDLHIGVALNLIFAIADVLEVDSSNMCEISLTETLAGDIDEATPFETSYVYGETHIEKSLIPDLEKLIELAGGDAVVSGELQGSDTTIPLVDALSNWNAQLSNSASLQATALENPIINRSFSASSEYEYVEQVDTTTVTYLDVKRVFINGNLDIGPFFGVAGSGSNFLLAGEIHSEWVSEEERTTGKTKSIGYVMSDGDAGDYFSVDVAKNPRYGTFVFGTRSGRSSFPHEPNTQKRDNPIISVDPPVLHNVPQAGFANFEVTLINGSESDEQRQYTLGAPGEFNRRGLGINVSGTVIGAGRTESYIIDPGTAITVDMNVRRGQTQFAYPKSAVMLYPKEEMEIWNLDRRQDFPLSDTAFFAIFYDSTASGSMATRLAEGWNWFSINRPGGEVDQVMGDFKFSHGDLIVDRTDEAQYDSTLGWTGNLTRLDAGAAYRFRLREPGYFYMPGDPVVATEPTELDMGWNWIGYLPDQPMPVRDALASLDDRVIDGDAIVSQHGFAQYVRDVGWVGTLKYMEPGEAYQLYLSGGGDLLYPEAPALMPPSDPDVRITTVNGPTWEVEPEEYGSSMIIVAEVAMLGAPLEQTTTKVAVTSGEDIRGVSDVRWVEELNRHIAFIQVYGDFEPDELLRVHVYDGEANVLYEDVASIKYASQTILGSATAPVSLELSDAGLAPEIRDIPEEFELFANYPNPFNPQTVIAYNLPETGQVTLRVYDVIGRLVTTLVNSEQTPGRYSVVFDARNYASGVYLYRLHYGATSAMGKMLLVK